MKCLGFLIRFFLVFHISAFLVFSREMMMGEFVFSCKILIIYPTSRFEQHFKSINVFGISFKGVCFCFQNRYVCLI